MRGVLRFVIAGVVAVLLTGGPAMAETCYADWSEAGPIVKSEGLVSAKDVQELASSQVAGKLIKITLCEDNGAYSYRLVFDQDGELQDMTVDAHSPFGQ